MEENGTVPDVLHDVATDVSLSSMFTETKKSAAEIANTLSSLSLSGFDAWREKPVIKRSMQSFLYYTQNLACCGPNVCSPTVKWPERVWSRERQICAPTPSPTSLPSRVWILLHCVQAAQHLACPLHLSECTLLLGCVLSQAGKQPGFGHWKWWFCTSLTRLLRWLWLREAFEWWTNSKTAVESGDKGKNQHIYIKKPQEMGKRMLPPSLNWWCYWRQVFENSALFPCTLWLKYKERGSSGNTLNC